MTLAECLAACLGLLMTPGPTNTLLTLSAAAQGRTAAFRLVPAEMTGYLLVVVPLVLFGEAMLAAAPQVSGALRIVAAVWVAYLAAKLWLSSPACGTGSRITLSNVFVTTMLNPKALLFGLFLLPSVDNARLEATVAVFLLAIATASTVWICLGALVRAGREGTVRRIAAVVLGALSARLFISVMPWMV